LEHQQIVERNVRKPPTVTQACREKVINLRAKTETMYEEMYQRKLLALAEEEHIKARRALFEANLSPAERKARDEDVREFQERYSALVPEASNSWREQENPFAAHYRQQMTTRKKL
jgi:hypothetical protein